MKKRFLAAMLTLAMSVTVFAGCGKEEPAKKDTEAEDSAILEAEIEEVNEDAEDDEEEAEEESEVSGDRGIEPAPAGMGLNPMTGEFVDAELAAQRPFALTIPCDKTCYPHYGVSTADVIYEASCRGDHGFPRTLYIWLDYSGMSRIGNTRSARTYHAAWAKEYDALFGHYGQSPFANPTLATMDDMNALQVDTGGIVYPALDSIMYFRSSDKSAPHNAYTSSEGIKKAIEKYDYRTVRNAGYEAHNRFAWTGETVELTDGYDATTVIPGFNSISAKFEYNPNDGLYYRYTYGSADKDGLNGNQIAVKNIILQKVDYSYYTTDDPAFAGLRNDASHWNGEKYLNIDLTSGGDGIYITNGKAIDVTWKKEGKEVDGLPTKFYDKKTGEEITYNKGKTWYCVILSDRWDLVTINDEKVNPEASPSPESPAVTAEPAQTQTETPAAQEPAQTQTEEKKTETTTEAKPEEPAQPATEAAPAPAPEQPAPEPAPEPEPEIPIIMEDFNPAMGEG
ncbi:MAG: DUF3048 domain-containing protein [Lachnospiraceae bacterium]|nr:DUF3048 domain-containing protein [Lachnospiraceae bacterium]